MQALQFDTIDSTNEMAKRLIAEGRIQESAYLLAREQTAGKGRHGHRWVSPRDAGIYLTVVDFPHVPATPSTTAYTLAAGVACVEALTEIAGLAVGLKPVNDLIADHRKLGGILTEAVIQEGSIEAMLIGVGINVTDVVRPLPDGVIEPTCVEALMLPEVYRQLDLDRLTARIVSRIVAWSALVTAGETARVRLAWERHKLPGSVCPML